MNIFDISNVMGLMNNLKNMGDSFLNNDTQQPTLSKKEMISSYSTDSSFLSPTTSTVKSPSAGGLIFKLGQGPGASSSYEEHRSFNPRVSYSPQYEYSSHYAPYTNYSPVSKKLSIYAPTISLVENSLGTSISPYFRPYDSTSPYYYYKYNPSQKQESSFEGGTDSESRGGPFSFDTTGVVLIALGLGVAYLYLKK